MEPTTTWSRAAGRASDLQGSLLLTNAALLLIGAWITLGFAPATSDAEAAPSERHPLALEAYDDACGLGDAVACNNLAVSYHNGYGTERDDTMALSLFTRACNAGSADACNNQAALLEQLGSGSTNGSVRAGATPIELYHRSCAGGSGLGCSNLGALYAKGEGVAREAGYARALFARACQLGSVTGCENLALLAARRAAATSSEN